MPAAPRLLTPRLELRPLRHDDLPALTAMLGDPVGMASWPAPLTPRECVEWIERNITRYRVDGFGRCAIVSRDTGEFLGDAGLARTEVEGAPEVELGWVVRHDLWGRGIATEAAMAWRDHAFTDAGLDRIVSMIDAANIASIRVAQKVGMTVERSAVWGGEPMLMYSLTRKAI